MRLRVVGWAAFAGAIALGWVAPQLLPALELTELSVRGLEGLGVEQASEGHATPSWLLRGLVGLPFDPAADLTGTRQWLLALPTLTLPLLALGWLARPQRAAWGFALAAALAAALLMLGPLTPLGELYHSSPGAGWFRLPKRMAFVYTFFAAIGIGIGVTGLRVALSRLRLAPRTTSVIALCGVALVGAELIARVDLTALHPVLAGESRGAPESVVSFLERQPGHWRFFIEERQTPTGRHTLLHKAGMMNGLFAVPDYEPSVPAIYAMLFEGRAPPIWHGGASVRPGLRARSAEHLGRLLDLMSVRFYVALDALPPRVRRMVADVADGRAWELGDVWVFERPSALPRAYVVPHVILETNAVAAIDRAMLPAFRPHQEAIVVDPDPDLVAFEGLLEGRDGHTDDAARIVRFENERVAIEAECAARCLLVLTDLHYPGWQVEVDGQEREIHVVNGLYRGVVLEPGRHVATYTYRPATLRQGWIACALAGGVVLATLLPGAARTVLRGRRNGRRP